MFGLLESFLLKILSLVLIKRLAPNRGKHAIEGDKTGDSRIL